HVALEFVQAHSTQGVPSPLQRAVPRKARRPLGRTEPTVDWGRGDGPARQTAPIPALRDNGLTPVHLPTHSGRRLIAKHVPQFDVHSIFILGGAWGNPVQSQAGSTIHL